MWRLALSFIRTLASEVIATVERGERFSAKFGRTGFRKNFAFNSTWRGKS
jgi:hypothetical protein